MSFWRNSLRVCWQSSWKFLMNFSWEFWNSDVAGCWINARGFSVAIWLWHLAKQKLGLYCNELAFNVSWLIPSMFSLCLWGELENFYVIWSFTEISAWPVPVLYLGLVVWGWLRKCSYFYFYFLNSYSFFHCFPLFQTHFIDRKITFFETLTVFRLVDRFGVPELCSIGRLITRYWFWVLYLYKSCFCAYLLQRIQWTFNLASNTLKNTFVPVNMLTTKLKIIVSIWTT